MATQSTLSTTARFSLVRNPTWSEAIDSLRPSYPTRIRLLLNKIPGGVGSGNGITRALGQGRLDLILDANPLPSEISAWQKDPALKSHLERITSNTVWFLTMNLAQPPFDDVSVRRAVALAIDRERLAGVSSSGYLPGPAIPATHLLPDGAEGGLLAAYPGPGWANGHHGDVVAARGEMRRSRYDTDGDGVCDADICRSIELLVADFGRRTGLNFPFERVSDIVRDVARDLSAVGIEVGVREVSRGFASSDDVRNLATDPREHVPLTLANWTADYPSGSGFLPFWFDRQRIGDPDTYAVSLLGATVQQLAAWGYDVTSVPSVNDRLDRCLALVGSEQVKCWAQLDKYLTEEVVPWVPLLFTEDSRHTSTRIAHFSWDGFVGFPALDRIALEPEGG